MSLQLLNDSRMSVLDTYTELERFLAETLRTIMGCPPDVAYTIFYRVTNTRARYAIMTDLMKMRYGNAFNPSWKKMQKWLVQFDATRNHLAHWSAVMEIGPDGGAWTLRNPVVHFANSPETPDYNPETLQDVRTLMVHMGNVLMQFEMCLSRGPESALWQIFQQPVTHQNPTEYLEHLIDAERQAQPEPQQA